MRIERLDLTAYGPFTETSLEFSGSPALEIVYGRNEAGKSSALRAIGDLFFGIPLQTKDDFVHRYDAMRLSAILRDRGGRRLEIVRRKGRAPNDLLDAAGRPLGRDVLSAFLGGAERAFFELAFGLDSERLQKGADELLAGGGEIGRALFQSASGVPGLASRLEGIEVEAAELWKERGKSQRVNAALSRLKELESNVKSTGLRAETWRSSMEELAKVRGGIEERIAARTGVDTTRERLERIRRCLPALARLQKSVEAVAGLEGVPLQPASFGTEAAAAREAVAVVTSSEAQLERRIAELETEAARLPAPGPLLARARDVEELHQQCGNVRGFRRDLPTREGELRQNLERAQSLAAQTLPGLGLDEALGTLPPQASRQALRRLAVYGRQIRQDLGSRGQDLEAEEKKLQAVREAIEGLGRSADPGPLARAIRDAGDPVKLVEKEERLRARAAAGVRESLSSLQGWALRSADDLAAAAVPVEATVERFRERFAELEAEERDLAAERKRLRAECETLQTKRRNLSAGGAVPTRAAVDVARGRRSAGWRLVRRAFVDSRADVDGEARAYDAERPLPEAFERAVDEADGTVDRLVDAADRVAFDAQLASRLAEVENGLRTCDGAATDLATRRLALEDEWRMRWRSAGVEPGTSAEMRDWLGARTRVLERLEKLRAVDEEVTGAKDALGRAHSSILAALAPFLTEPLPEEVPYPVLLARAEETRARLDAAAGERKSLEKAVSDGTRKVIELAAAVARLRKDEEGWSADWVKGTAPFRRPAGVGIVAIVGIVEMEAVLDASDDLELVKETVTSLNDRVTKMRAGIQTLEAEVSRHCRELAPDISGADAVAAAEALFARLGEARTAEDRRRAVASDLEKSRKGLVEARAKGDEARRQLENLCRRAGCGSADELAARAEVIDRKRRALEEQRLAADELGAAGAGRSVADVTADCGSVDTDGIPGGLERLKEERDRLDGEIGELRGREGELVRELKGADGGDGAAVLVQEAAGVRADLERDAWRWMLLATSAFLLRRTIESWRKENQAPLLREAAGTFASLTRGGFDALLAEAGDDGQPVLVAQRRNGQRVGLPALSVGTRDQLYLSLRLASLARYAEKTEPLPFIADDLLVSFDEDRAASALGVLARFSRDVQVILFTHHRHVVDLATSRLPAGEVRVHALGA